MYIHQTSALLAACLLAGGNSFSQSADAIVGRWKATEKTLTIDIYRSGAEYRARIVTFTDHHNPTPAEARRDEKNPDPAKRNRKLLGLDVLTGLHYDCDERAWTDGQIYDVSSGKHYDARLDLDGSGHLHVRAYKGISLLGKTMQFIR